MTDRITASRIRNKLPESSPSLEVVGNSRLNRLRLVQGGVQDNFEQDSETEGAESNRPTIDEIVNQVRDLPMMPSVVFDVMNMAGRGNVSARQLSDVIGRDPGFTARVLKLANSAFYGLPRNVSTIHEAVTMLGNRSLRNMAIVAATHDVLAREVGGYELGVGDLWRHSLACGLAAQMIANQVRTADGEEAFVCGLLHDVGKVVLGTYLSKMKYPLQQWLDSSDGSFTEAERSVLGYDHAEIGSRVAMRWNLPTPLIQAIAWHHEPVQEGTVVQLPAIIHIADIICLTAGMGLGSNGLRVNVSSEAMLALGLDEIKVMDILDRLVARIAEAQPLFTLKSLI